jgi:hypothetical protein
MTDMPQLTAFICVDKHHTFDEFYIVTLNIDGQYKEFLVSSNALQQISQKLTRERLRLDPHPLA